MFRISPTTLGMAMMLLGMFLFTANDALGKWLVASYSVGQVLLIRSLGALCILLPFVFAFGWRNLIRLERPKVQFARVCFSTAEVFCFYFAVRYMPLADTMTFWLAAPIYVALLAPIFLRETVGMLRWAAILLGFVGVIIALEPTGQGFGIAGLIAVLGSFCFALMLITGRHLRETPDIALVFWQLIGAGLAGFVAAPVGWIMPSSLDWALLALVGVVAMGAHLCVNRALKLADAGLLAPLQYTLLLWAIILGWIFFDDIPRTTMLVGAAIIVLGGLLLVMSDKQSRPKLTRPHKS
ncbi:DMT family transporter [Roseicyclus sp.]|uniref:DMT family transporter n=1 Tax=Roseicyclus sp. TaxID=1914329 RepID=UPI003F6C3478